MIQQLLIGMHIEDLYAQNHYIYIYIYLSCTVAHHDFPSNGAARRPPGRAIARLRATQLRFQRQNQPGIPGARTGALGAERGCRIWGVLPSGYVKIAIKNDHLQWIFP